MGCVCGRPAAIDDGRCVQTPPPAGKLSAAGAAVPRREEEARKQARARDEALERRRAAAMAMAAGQVRSPVPRALEAEQVAAGWPPWLASVAAEAVRGWVPRRAESFEKLDKVTLYSFLRCVFHILLVALVSASGHRNSKNQ